jgi:hypothetical protein
MTAVKLDRATPGPRGHTTDRGSALRKDSYVRPYTQFARAGMYRFRGGDVAFRPFRVT